MPYTLTKTNGTTLAVIQDASVDTTTNLTFVGKNYSGYGQVIDENFVKLLENFSNNSAPTKPLQGQLWFDNTPSIGQLKLCYDGANFKGLASIRVQSNTPDSSVAGDLWWDNSYLRLFNGSAYTIIGPSQSASSRSSWVFEEDIGQQDSGNTSYPIIKGEVGGIPIVTITKLGTTLDNTGGALVPQTTSNLYTNFSNGVIKGITLAGCDSNGSSKSAGYYFWGTASESLNSSGLNLTQVSDNTNYYITFASGSSGNQTVNANSTFTFNPSTGVVNATATAAYYADLAERYEADAVYEEGTVLVIGGEKEVTTTNQFADTRVAGIVSKTPAYMMNSAAGSDETHPYIALKGRVPCKVLGYVKKGDLIVTSSTPGYGCAASSVSAGAVIGKALGSQSEGLGIIEVLVV